MESARVVKAVRNRVNRETNCDSANMDKAINAAMRQVGNDRMAGGKHGT